MSNNGETSYCITWGGRGHEQEARTLFGEFLANARQAEIEIDHPIQGDFANGTSLLFSSSAPFRDLNSVVAACAQRAHVDMESQFTDQRRGGIFQISSPA